MAVFIREDALSVWTNLGKHLLFVWLFVSSIKTGTRRIIRLDKLFSVVRRSRRITEDSSPRRIIRLVPVFILETNNQTNNKCLPKFVQTDNASSSIKTGNIYMEIELKYYLFCIYNSNCTKLRKMGGMKNAKLFLERVSKVTINNYV